MTSIPANYLSKILHALRNAGLLDSARGVGGGYTLARPMKQIHLIEVAELFEGVRAIPNCVLGSDYTCSDIEPCGAHAEWKRVRTRFISFLEKTTLADIAAKGLPFSERKPISFPPHPPAPRGARL